MATITECPDCGGTDLYDNREANTRRVAEGKKSMPTFKCKACNWVKWPPRQQTVLKTGTTVPNLSTVLDLPELYDHCLQVAVAQLAGMAKRNTKLGLPTWEAIIAATATLFIQASRQGRLHPESPSNSPESPKGEDDELPFN